MTTMSLITYIGIDPGATGGIAILYGSAVQAITMPHSEKTLYDLLHSHASPPGECCAAIEQVGGYVESGGPKCPVCGQQENRSPGSSMFEFGEGYGFLCACLISSGLTSNKGDPSPGTFLLTPPQRWQSGLHIDPRRKGESKTDWKNRLKWNAQELFPKKRYPNLSITLRTADALLIALYVKQQYTSYLKRRGV